MKMLDARLSCEFYLFHFPAQVDSAWAAGDRVGAIQNSNRAKGWSLAGIIFAVVLYVVVTIVVVAVRLSEVRLEARAACCLHPAIIVLCRLHLVLSKVQDEAHNMKHPACFLFLYSLIPRLQSAALKLDWE